MLDAADRLEIHELLALYGHLVDAGQWDQLGRVLTDDVRYDATQFGLPVTTNLAELIAEWTSEEGLTRHPLAHHTTNIVVTVDADGTVRAASKGIGVGHRGRVGSVVYEDVVVRNEGTWKIASRMVTLRRSPHDRA